MIRPYKLPMNHFKVYNELISLNLKSDMDEIVAELLKLTDVEIRKRGQEVGVKGYFVNEFSL